MKVVFQPPIMDLIRRAKNDAAAQDRTIEKIVVTDNEYRELIRYFHEVYMFCAKPMTVLGIKVERE